LLEENGILGSVLTEKMVKAIGFRSLIVHQYGKIDVERVFEVARKDIQDLNDFLVAILEKLGLAR